MIVVRMLSVLALTLVTGFAHAQECAIGPAPACAGTCQAGSVCTIGQSGTPCECVPAAPLTITKLAIKLNFAKTPYDSINLQGTIPVPDGFSAAGRTVSVDIGGAVATFTLDDKGKSKREGAQTKLTVKSSKGVVVAQDAKFSVKLNKADFSDTLADEGLIDATLDEVAVEVRAEVSVDAVVYQKLQPQTYKAKQGKTGSAK